jgi:hypothetical protein
MTAMPTRGTSAQEEPAPAASAGRSRDSRTSPIPTFAMITTRATELRRRRGLMIALIAVYIGIPALFMVIRLLLHAFAPRNNPPAGNEFIFAVLVAGLVSTFGFIVAAALGCTAGSRDLSEGMFRQLVVTGRSRLALYLARIPAGLAIVVPLVAIGYTIVCAVSFFAAPTFVDDSNLNIPPGLSRPAFEHWAAGRADPVICSLPYSGYQPVSAGCVGPPWWSKSTITPAQPASPRLEALAVRIAGQDYPGYTRIVRRPAVTLMIKAGLWLELEAATGFILGLGLASLMGQRLVPMILIMVVQLILTPVFAVVAIPHLQNVQRALVGLAMAHLEPSGLPTALVFPTGNIAVGHGRLLLAESAAQASLVIITWLVGWTVLGAWRMMTRDA